MKYVIVGAGLSGLTIAERIANQLNEEVLIIEKRNHIGGNIYDFYEDGILIQKYGPHIFHTNEKIVYEYLSEFTEWLDYEHHVLSNVGGKLVPMPICIDTLNALYGLDLDEESMRKVTERIIELGDKKELVTQEDLPYIVSDVLKHGVVSESVKLKSYIVTLAHGLKPMATVKIEINGKEFEENSSGDGQYDAFVRALRKIYKVTLGRKFPMLTNYAVSIPPGGRTDAFVQTVITWSFEEKVFRTRGLDADQTEAAIKATMKMLNIIENEYE